ncbi:DUF4181 domain-containing protein [Neobacillus sp. YIM B06451]|uniref:DUF4181 domain-containing protein n=1 Tax=Neobacillus sp. YIM B06451 TaxID=3070994 RepID=UPI00292E4C9C|nr:DUF4181 domain-containing protein [Neobacillus sp. YIM B06451]
MLPLLILGLLLPASEYFLRRLIVGTGERFISETDGKYVHIVGRIVLVITSLLLLLFVVDTSDEMAVKRFLLILLAIIYGFDSFIEWKYIKSSKACIVPILLLLIGTIYCFIFIF